MASGISTASSSTCTWLMLCVWLDEADVGYFRNDDMYEDDDVMMDM